MNKLNKKFNEMKRNKTVNLFFPTTKKNIISSARAFESVMGENSTLPYFRFYWSL